MPKLIKNATIVENPWKLLPKDVSLENVLASLESDLIVPVQLWLTSKTELQQSGKKIAVWLDSDEAAGLLADDINNVDLIALNFPTFMDGRSYSTAALLRQHYKYSGELRAIGDVLKDQLSYMKRCGFDSFDVDDQVKVEDALSAFNDFTHNYQSNIDVPEPLFRRR